MSLIAIGDIHGCLRTLQKLLAELKLTKKDHLIFVGDYIDRGPDSKGVIDFLIELSDSVKCTFLRGNHEELLLGYLDYSEYNVWAMNGGVETLMSYSDSGERAVIPPEHVEWVRNTKIYFETPHYFFVHAGLRPQLTIRENLQRFDEEVFLWERSHLVARTFAWEKTVVCGHTPVPKPINKPRLINIDTGCVYYRAKKQGRLTAVRLPQREFVSVDYCDRKAPD